MRIILINAFLLITSVLAAQTSNINTFSRQKYESAVTTAEMRQAAMEEGQLWQNLYQVVLDHLELAVSKPGKQALLNREEAWIEYLSSENDFLNQMYFRELQGTMWYPVSDGARSKLYELRVSKLLDEYDLLARSQMAYSDFPPELILGEWSSSEVNLQFFDDFTAIQEPSVQDGLMFYTLLMKDEKLTLSLLQVIDLSLIQEFEIISQNSQQMILKEGEKEVVFKKVN